MQQQQKSNSICQCVISCKQKPECLGFSALEMIGLPYGLSTYIRIRMFCVPSGARVSCMCWVHSIFTSSLNNGITNIICAATIDWHAMPIWPLRTTSLHHPVQLVPFSVCVGCDMTMLSSMTTFHSHSTGMKWLRICSLNCGYKSFSPWAQLFLPIRRSQSMPTDKFSTNNIILSAHIDIVADARVDVGVCCMRCIVVPPFDVTFKWTAHTLRWHVCRWLRNWFPGKIKWIPTAYWQYTIQVICWWDEETQTVVVLVCRGCWRVWVSACVCSVSWQHTI